MGSICKPLHVMPIPMDGAFLAEVLDELDKVKPSTPDERREFPRLIHRCLNVVLILNGAGGEIAFMVATRNISQGGASILHRQMLYPGERCRLVLPLPDSKHLLVLSEIVRCRHVRGLTHELGVRFNGPIAGDDLEKVLMHGPLKEITPDRSR
jgi:hypothetical protein